MSPTAHWLVQVAVYVIIGPPRPPPPPPPPIKPPAPPPAPASGVAIAKQHIPPPPVHCVPLVQSSEDAFMHAPVGTHRGMRPDMQHSCPTAHAPVKPHAMPPSIIMGAAPVVAPAPIIPDAPLPVELPPPVPVLLPKPLLPPSWKPLLLSPLPQPAKNVRAPIDRKKNDFALFMGSSLPAQPSSVGDALKRLSGVPSTIG